jgi:RNA polymerase sigma-70 factor (ECF subfamily)
MILPAPETTTTSVRQPSRHPADLSTRELMDRFFQNADQHAFETLFVRYHRELCRYCKKFVADTDLADEIVGDVFFALWKNRGNYQIQTSAASYLFVATRNRAYDYLRKIQRQKFDSLDGAYLTASADASALDNLAAADIEIAIQAAVETLAPSCRQIFRLSRDEGKKYQEIADQLGISIKTVETQMGRALKHLREEVGKKIS